MTEPGRHVPVDEPDIIPGRVFTHFLERHTLALKSAVVLACEQVAGELFAFDLQLPYFPDDVFGGQVCEYEWNELIRVGIKVPERLSGPHRSPVPH